MKRILFVCSQNRLRSPTAEQIFADHPELEVISAGTKHDADNPLDAEQIAWADQIFVMERNHKQKIQQRFRHSLRANIVVLGIPDDYRFMQPELIDLLKSKMRKHL